MKIISADEAIDLIKKDKVFYAANAKNGSFVQCDKLTIGQIKSLKSDADTVFITEGDHAELERELEESRENIGSLKKDLESANKKAIDYYKQLSESKKVAEEAKARIKVLERTVDELNDVIEDLKKSIDELKKQ